MWSRRQLLGLLPILINNKYQLEDLQKDVSVLRQSENATQTVTDTEISKLKINLGNMSALVDGRSKDSQKAIDSVRSELNSKFRLFTVIGVVLLLSLLIWCVILSLKLRNRMY